MASTYSDLKFELIGTGEQSGTWGTTTNTNLGTAIEEAITGSADVTFASATVTLTLTDTNASQTARNLRLNLTGTSGGAQDLEVPAIEKFYIVNNGCADTITVKVSGQTGVGVPAGKAMLLFNNGTDVVDAVSHFSSLTLGTDLAVADGGTGASDAATARSNLSAAASGSNSDITELSGLTTALSVSQGGTGATTLTSNNVILGNGTSAPNFVAPGSSGNVLTSNGTTWTSAAAAAFDSGTRMMFAQTAAPTGWTKDTTNYNNHSLRVVTGTAGTGGTVDFTSAFTSQTPAGTVTITSVTGSAGATTLSTPQIPSHTHGNVCFAPGGDSLAGGGNRFSGVAGNSGATGGGGSHTHPFSFSSGSGSFSGNAINLAVKYLDVITATKD